MMLFALFWFGAAPAVAQTAILTGGVFGGGAPLAGAMVEALTNGTTSVVATSTTNSAGQYSLTLALATYDLRVTPASGSGFAPEIVQDVEVTGNRQFDVILLASGGGGTSITVSGTVRGAGGQAIPGTSVFLRSGPFGSVLASTSTNSSGQYVVTSTVMGPVTLQFNGGGTSPSQPSNWFYRRRDIPVAPAITFDLDLPVATISGVVTDAGGTAVPGSSISASSSKPFDTTTQAEWNSSGFATAASPGGGYAVRLLTGTASFTVTPPASAAATPVSVSNVTLAGDLTRDFTLGAAVAVSGIVRGLGTSPLSGVNVTARSDTTGQTLGTATTDLNGAYSVRAADGPVTLTFSRFGTSPLQPSSWTYRRRSLAISGPATFNLDLPVVTVSGRTLDSDNAALGGVSLSASTNTFDGQTDWSSNDFFTSGTDGTYSVRLLTGTATFTLTAPSNADATPVRVSNLALTGDLTRDFTLGAAIQVGGIVRGIGGQPLGGVSVQASSPTTGLTLGTATTDGAGMYTVRAAPGQIDLQFNRSGAPSSIQPAFWSYRRRNIAASDGTTFDVDLPVIRLNGTVADSNGVPVPDVGISAGASKFESVTQTNWSSNGSVGTDASGNYSILLLSGSGSLNISPPSGSGFAPASLGGLSFASNVTQRVVLQRPDTTPPVIVGTPVVVHLSDTSVSIGWITSEPATSVVEYGLGDLANNASSTALTTNHSITLQNLGATAIYSFRVSSTDGSGNGPAASQTAFFTTQAPPGDVTPPVITSGPTLAAVGDRSAVVQWTTDEPSTSRVDYGPTGQLGTRIEAELGRFVQSHSMMLTALDPSTTYFLQVSTADPDGNGPAQSSVISFTTAAAPDTQAPLITNLRVISATHNSLTVGWTTNEAATTAVSYNDGIVFEVASDGALVTTHEITLAGLGAQRTYSITASSRDGAGNGPTIAGPILGSSLATPDTTPPGIGTIAIDASRDRATLTWTTTEPASREVRYGTAQGGPDQVQAGLALATSHQSTLTGLIPSTTYYGSIIATDASGNPSTSAFELTTQAAEVNVPPTAPGPLTVSSSPNNTGSFIITWGASVDDGPGGVAQYEVLRNGVVVATVAAPATSHAETEIAEGTHTYRVRAIDHEGLTSQSADLLVIVDMTSPQLLLPDNVSTPATTSTDALVTFTAIATDALPVAVACTPASGSAFPIGETTVNCTAEDTAGNKSAGSFVVHVIDPFAPTLSVPASFAINAPDSQGATVTFTATSTDNADPDPTVTCTPASGSLFPIGTTPVSCTATDESGNAVTRTFDVTVIAPPKTDTTTSLSVGPAAPSFGSQVTLTASVTSGSGAPTGSVEFSDGQAVIGLAPLSGSPATASLETASLAVGAHSIVARYLGSDLHNASDSLAQAVAVDKAAPTLIVTGGTFLYDGAAHPATVTITGATGETLGPVAVRYNGVFAPPVSAGPYSVDATFDGNGNYHAITRTAHIQITATATATVLALSAPTAVFGEPVTAVATVAPATGIQPTGAVRFFVGSVPVADVPVTPGTTSSIAMLALANLTIGANQMTAFYIGDGNFTSSNSNVASVTVAKAATDTTTSASVAASVSGETVRLTATVKPAAPGAGMPAGAVEFLDSGVALGSAPLQADGSAVLALSSLAVGAHSITAEYAGDGNFLGSTAAALSHSVARADVVVATTASPAPSGFGEPVVVKVDVSIAAPGSGVPTGNVDLFSNGQPLGSGSLEVIDGRSVVTVSTTSLAAGDHVFTASYAGDTRFNPGTSAAVSHTVNERTASTATEITLPPTAPINTLVTLDAAVSTLAGSADPTGTVEFLDGSSLLGSAPLALSRGAMRASLDYAFTSAGARQITARYVPSGAMAASESAPGSITVYDPAVSVPETTRTSINAPRKASFGDTVLAKVDVRAPGNGAAPTGEVDVYVDGVLHTRATLVDGEAGVTITGLARGMHNIVATYRGDSTYAGSTSSADVNVVK